MYRHAATEAALILEDALGHCDRIMEWRPSTLVHGAIGPMPGYDVVVVDEEALVDVCRDVRRSIAAWGIPIDPTPFRNPGSLEGHIVLYIADWRALETWRAGP